MPTDGSDYYNQLVKEDKRHGKKGNRKLETPEGPRAPKDNSSASPSIGSDHDGSKREGSSDTEECGED